MNVENVLANIASVNNDYDNAMGPMYKENANVNNNYGNAMRRMYKENANENNNYGNAMRRMYKENANVNIDYGNAMRRMYKENANENANVNNNYGNAMRRMYKENANVNIDYGNAMRRMYGENKKGFDCEADGFDMEMRLTKGGLEFKKRADFIHADGEQWSYEKLVEFAMDGRIIDWYIEQLEKQGIVFTPNDIATIKSNRTLEILSAFFFRYKIVAERLQAVVQLFDSIDLDDRLISKRQYKQLKAFHEKAINSKVVQVWDFPIQKAVERAQCLMFYIVKHKGELPPGFVMDKRVEERAAQPIILSDWHLLQDEFLGRYRNLPPKELMEKRINALLIWLSFLESEFRKLAFPPVDFDIFD